VFFHQHSGSPSCFHLLTADSVQAGYRLGLVDKMKCPNLPMHWSTLGATNANTSVTTSLVDMSCTDVRFCWGSMWVLAIEECGTEDRARASGIPCFFSTSCDVDAWQCDFGNGTEMIFVPSET
jgi:hypothetical protein